MAGELLWAPGEALVEQCNATAFLRWLERERGLRFDGYAELWQWSVSDLEQFWAVVWDYFGVGGSYSEVLDERRMPGARWFGGARVNYARSALARADGQPAIIFESEARPAGSCRSRSCATRSAPAPHGCASTVSNAAIASSRTCRTCRRRSSRSSRRRRSARSGRRAPPSSACRASSIASRRSSRASCSPRTGMSTAARHSTGRTRSAPCRRICRRSSTSCWSTTSGQRRESRPRSGRPSSRSIGSTASPLSPEGFRWIYDAVAADVLVGSASGGTDVCTPFVGSSPLLPVYAGELQCRLLGVAAEAWNAAGVPVTDDVGELVVVEPMPSMPLFFWGDEDGTQYHESYFELYPGIWRHGDWATFTSRGTAIVHGRSDWTTKRGGVRTGTSEFYSVVERLPEVADSLVIERLTGGDGKSEILLFVVLEPPATLTPSLESEIKARLRVALSPRHVPDRVLQIEDVPRTLNGKKLEVPVRRLLEGAAKEHVVVADAMSNPESLAYFVELAR